MTETIDPPRSAQPADKYKTFVGAQDADDISLTNLVAYALYKQVKRQWMLKLKADKKRSLTSYYETWTRTTIEALRDRAQASLAAFGESVVEDAKPEMLKEALRGKFVAEVGKAMSASFVYTLILIAAVIVLLWSGGESEAAQRTDAYRSQRHGSYSMTAKPMILTARSLPEGLERPAERNGSCRRRGRVAT